jgi:DNA-binding transcriptional MerR regulator
MRIGELAARTGVNTATLRAWERRYGLLRPARTDGGQRVYGDEDVARVRAVLALANAGVRVSEAAGRLTATPPADPAIAAALAAETVRELWAAVDAFDERAADAVLSAASVTLGVPLLLDAVLVPTLRRLGAEWRQSPRNIAREHFASTLVRSHLVRLLPTADTAGPPCLAFCPEGEQHDIGLLMAAVTLASTGRPPVVLGAHTPSASIDLLLQELRPSVVLVAASTRRPVLRFFETWRPQAGCIAVAGGSGFRPEDAVSFGGRVHLGPYDTLPAAVAAR